MTTLIKGEKIKEKSIPLTALNQDIIDKIEQGGGTGSERTINLDLNELLVNNGFNVEYNNNFIEEFFKDPINTTILIGGVAPDTAGRPAGFQTYKVYPIMYEYPHIALILEMPPPLIGDSFYYATVVLSKDSEVRMEELNIPIPTKETLGAAFQSSKIWEFTNTLTHDLSELITTCYYGVPLNIHWVFNKDNTIVYGGRGLGIVSPLIEPREDGGELMITFIGVNFMASDWFVPYTTKLILNEQGQILEVGEISKFEGLLNSSDIATNKDIDALFDESYVGNKSV